MTIGYRFEGSRHVKWSRLRASPIKNDAGEVIWALNFFTDITSQVWARERERILNQVTESLSASLRTTPNLKALADIVVPSVASWCSFRLHDEFDRPFSEVISFPDSPDSQILFALVDVIGPDLDPAAMHARVVANGRHELVSPITGEMLGKVEQERGVEAADVLKRLDIGSILCIPLGAGGLWLGTMTLARPRAEGGFDPVDLELVEEIATRAGVALANSRVYEHEHQTAEALRLGLTPLFMPDIHGLEIAARYQPLARAGHVGGDFFDVLEVDDETSVLFIGDVEGKGVGAAAVVGLARHTLRATVALDQEPLIVLNQLNEALASQPDARLCTLAYVVFERDGLGFSATVSLAGHPPPLVIRSDGTREEIGTPCPPAGVSAHLEPVPEKVDLRPGDTLILYTDGLSIQDMPSSDTVDFLLPSDDVESVDTLLSGMLARFHEAVPEPRDDIALLAVRVVSEV
ncbi:MAG: PP2C family protein-serine/threonine phosphatase [Acidimicrobiia bacterium]